MAVLNYYLGLQRGQLDKVGIVVNGTASNGANSDVELRMQINNGTVATGLTRLDVIKALRTFEKYLNGNGVVPGFVPEYLPVL